MKIEGYQYEICVKYTDLDIFKHYCKNKKIDIENIEYLENAVCKINVDRAMGQQLLQDDVDKKIKTVEIKEICKKYITKSI